VAYGWLLRDPELERTAHGCSRVARRPEGVPQIGEPARPGRPRLAARHPRFRIPSSPICVADPDRASRLASPGPDGLEVFADCLGVLISIAPSVSNKLAALAQGVDIFGDPEQDDEELQDKTP
jgi:hypothetical protein